MDIYKLFILGFVIQALVFASISALSIETRLNIFSTKQKIPVYKEKNLINLFNKFVFYLKTLPYEISERLNLLIDGKVPEYIKLIYTFLISFTISLIVYNLFLLILGKKFIYKFFFGNLNSKKKLK